MASMEYRRDGGGEEKAGHKVLVRGTSMLSVKVPSQEQSQRHFGVPRVVGSDNTRRAIRRSIHNIPEHL